jgi:hypothetical protein
MIVCELVMENGYGKKIPKSDTSGQKALSGLAFSLNNEIKPSTSKSTLQSCDKLGGPKIHFGKQQTSTDE